MMWVWTRLRSLIVLQALKSGNIAEDECSKTDERSIGDDSACINAGAFALVSFFVFDCYVWA